MASSRSTTTSDFFYTTAPTGSPDSVAPCNLLVAESDYVKNRIHFYGPREGFEAKAVKEGLYVRVDMPGVEEEDMEVSLQNDTVFVKGEARKEWEQEIYGRLYCGSIDLIPESGKKVALLKKDLKNGVLTMVLDACGFRPSFCSTTITQFISNNLEFPAGWSCIRDYLLFNKEFMILNSPDKYRCYYPFQVGGINGAYRVMKGDKLFWTEDMPGVSKEEVCLKFNKRGVYFGGDSEESENDEKRRYFGSFRLQCDCCNITDVKTEMKAGVLKLLVSKEKFKSCSICGL